MRSKPVVTVAIILAAIITVAAVVSAMQTSGFAHKGEYYKLS
jgi:hypothetical protein